jgi:hypothetical protein
VRHLMYDHVAIVAKKKLWRPSREARVQGL